MSPLFLSSIGALLIAAASAILTLTAESGWRFRKWLPWVALVGALLNVTSTWFADTQKQQADAARNAKALELENVQKETLRLGRELEAYTKGEGSVVYLEPTVSSQHHAFIAALVNAGTAPAYDVKVRIIPDPRRIYPKEGKANYQVLIRACNWSDELTSALLLLVTLPAQHLLRC